MSHRRLPREQRPSRLVTLDITSVAAGGDGVARHDGLVVFVPRTAPGDRVKARITAKGRMARGVALSVESPGAGRTAPRCPHYEHDQCGGCQLQHLTLDAQREAKAHIVRDAFLRIGKRQVLLPEVRGIGDGFGYRRKLTLALRWTGAGWTAGMHRAGSPDEVFQLDDCLIADALLVAGFKQVLVQGAALLPRASQLRVSLRRSGNDLLLVVEGGERWPESEAFADAATAVAAVWWEDEHGTRRLIRDRRQSPDAGASFVQVNATVAAMMAEHTESLVLGHAPATVIDAYAGVGDLAASLAGKGVAVTAIELDADASALSAAGLAAPSRAVQGRVERELPPRLPADVVVLNPPRAGVAPEVTLALASCDPKPRAIVYISCDPATLARDVARLHGWRVSSLVCFDMFPQTAHVESVCELVPEAQ